MATSNSPERTKIQPLHSEAGWKKTEILLSGTGDKCIICREVHPHDELIKGKCSLCRQK